MYSSIRCAASKSTFPPDAPGNAVAVVLFEDTTRLPPGYEPLDKAVDGVLSAAMTRPEFSAARGTLTCLYPAPAKKGQTGSRGKQGGRLYVVGLGRRAQCGHGHALRVAGAKLVRAAHGAQVKRLELALSAGLGDVITAEFSGRDVAAGLAIGNFEFDNFKGAVTAKQSKKSGTRVSRPDSRGGTLTVQVDASMRRGLARELRIGESMNQARALAATPPNVATPSYLVSYCRRLARQVGLRCTVIDAKRAAQLKMGGLVAVGAAGSTPPALICLEWKGAGTRGRSQRRKPIMLVGKAITFDTGGYSIKPPAGMDSMKYDKCGGMAVIGAMHAIARLKLDRYVVAVIPTAENMIDENGYRPSDILRMFNGVTVEVTNTDAEGRLILADALAYGCKTYRPEAVVDLATLTGGVVVGLGRACAGVFYNDDKLRRRLADAAEQTGERLWELPLWEEHKALLKSEHADIVNAGGREAHPSQGAAFLSYFVDEKTPWAHLDIAGVNDVKNETELYTKGPTGFGVRLLVRAIETWH